MDEKKIIDIDSDEFYSVIATSLLSTFWRVISKDTNLTTEKANKTKTAIELKSAISSAETDFRASLAKEGRVETILNMMNVRSDTEVIKALGKFAQADLKVRSIIADLTTDQWVNIAKQYAWRKYDEINQAPRIKKKKRGGQPKPKVGGISEQHVDRANAFDNIKSALAKHGLERMSDTDLLKYYRNLFKIDEWEPVKTSGDLLVIEKILKLLPIKSALENSFSKGRGASKRTTRHSHYNYPLSDIQHGLLANLTNEQTLFVKD